MSCFDEQEWEALQDGVWEHGDIWGTDRFAVRNWLQKEWEENEATLRAPNYNKRSLSETKDHILDWWWQKYEDQDDKQHGKRRFTVKFAKWLKEQFDTKMREERKKLKVNPEDHRVLPPRKIPLRFM